VLFSKVKCIFCRGLFFAAELAEEVRVVPQELEVLIVVEHLKSHKRIVFAPDPAVKTRVHASYEHSAALLGFQLWFLRHLFVLHFFSVCKRLAGRGWLDLLVEE
jgi:hypothetical protein